MNQPLAYALRHTVQQWWQHRFRPNQQPSTIMLELRSGEIGPAVEAMIASGRPAPLIEQPWEDWFVVVPRTVIRAAAGPWRRTPPLPGAYGLTREYLTAVLPGAPGEILQEIEAIGNPRQWAVELYLRSLHRDPGQVRALAAELFPQGFGYPAVRFGLVALTEVAALCAVQLGALKQRTDKTAADALDWLSGTVIRDPQNPGLCIFGREYPANQV